MSANTTCCFFGHRQINETETMKNNLYGVIEDLIVSKGVDTFLFGSKSRFDRLCLDTVSLLRTKHPHIKRIYVRAEFPDIDDRYRDYLLERYEDTFFPDNIRNAGRASYIKRNQIMIDLCRFCVVYYDESYLPPRRKNSKKTLTDYQPRSGTKYAFEYAVKKNIEIINILNK